jgi:hypothetical protein
MAILLHRLPFFKQPTTLAVHGERLLVKAYQIIVWVSICPEEEEAWNPRSARIPAILDTGHSHNFSIQRRHLVQWAGIHPESLSRSGYLRERGRNLPAHAADLWLYRNEPGQRDVFANQPPGRLGISGGIAVYPDDGSNYPRLPLLGLKALADNHLHLTISGWRRSVKLRTRRRWWLFD